MVSGAGSVVSRGWCRPEAQPAPAPPGVVQGGPGGSSGAEPPLLCVSLQALPYVCLLIAMLFFIYAIIVHAGGCAGPPR